MRQIGHQTNGHKHFYLKKMDSKKKNRIFKRYRAKLGKNQRQHSSLAIEVELSHSKIKIQKHNSVSLSLFLSLSWFRKKMSVLSLCFSGFTISNIILTPSGHFLKLHGILDIWQRYQCVLWGFKTGESFDEEFRTIENGRWVLLFMLR